jgi:PKD repeat protein
MVRNLSEYRFNYSFLFWFILLTLNLLFFFILDASAATKVSLEWAQNSEQDLAGYRVFCREQSQSYDYANPSWEGTDTYCTIYDLDETKTYFFVIRAFDTEGFESGDSNEVCHMPTVIPDNQPPIANAGSNQTVDEGQLVNLNGSNSTDPDDGIASYHWVQIGEPTVTLSDPNGKQPTFTAPDVGVEGASLSFELTVVDYSGLESRDSCIINVTWLNEPPVADAGPDQTVNEVVVVTLDGSSSLDIDDGITSYLWTQIGVPAVTLSNPASSQPTFTAPNVEQDGASLNFNLTVTDAGGLRNTDSCIVNISWENKPPIAVVAPDYVETTEETLVSLDGAASVDPDGGIASHLWTQVEGDPVSLSDPTSAVTTFTAPKADQYGKNLKFKLTVKDFGGLQDTADSSIYVSSNELPNDPPSAVFNVVVSRKVASFTDNSSDADGTIVSWFWSFGDSKTSTERNPIHRYVKFRNYSVTLTVTDDKGTSNSTSKNITVTK